MLDIVYVNLKKDELYPIFDNEYFYFDIEGQTNNLVNVHGTAVEKVGIEDSNKILVIRKLCTDGTPNEILTIKKKKTLDLKKGDALYIIKGSVKIDSKEYEEKTWINISSGDMKKALTPNKEAVILLTKNPAQS